MSNRAARQRAEKAFRLRAIGRSWWEVANELGYRSHGAAQTAVKRHLARECSESAEVSRRSLEESARITHSVLFDRFAAAVAREDDPTTALLARELWRNRDQIAKLTGAYAPERAEVTVNATPAEVIDDAENKLLALVGSRPSRVVEGEVLKWEDTESLVRS